MSAHGGDFHRRTAHRGHERNVELNGEASHHVPVSHGTAGDRGHVHDETHLPLAHQIEGVRVLSFCDSIDGGHGDVVPPQCIGRALGGVQREPDGHQFLCHGNEVLLVFIAHRQVGAAFGGHGHFRGQSGLEVGQVGSFVRTVDFAGGLHFGSRCRVQASQFDEGEHGGFDADLAGSATRNVLLPEWLADGDASSDSGQWQAGGFGDEGDGP